MSRINISRTGPLRGEVAPPADKSISHRAIMFSSIAEGVSTVRNFLEAEDPLSTITAFRQMGIKIDAVHQPPGSGSLQNKVVIHGRGLNGLSKPDGIIDCGNSGTTMRLLSGILAGQPFESTLSGDASLRSRPMKRIITPLSEMGAQIVPEGNGYPPLRVTGGNLKPISYRSPVASAQVKSAVLLAGLYCDGTTSVLEPGKSRDHTERMLKACGVNIQTEGLKVQLNGNVQLKPMDMTVPGDISSAAFFIAAGLIVPQSEILVKDVGINPTRTGILEILSLMGADLTLENRREVSGEPVADILVKHSRLKGIEIGSDLVLKAIDEFPVICVLAAKASGTTRITGAEELRVKESDRIASMASALKKMGATVEELYDGIVIEGCEQLMPAETKSFGDHRVAMSIVIAGLTIEGETVVDDADCINTSFPGFMEMLGGLES